MDLSKIISICSSLFGLVLACKTPGWRNMTLEELLIRSDVVIYGKDVDHGKFRLPNAVDARFDVYCVFKKGSNIVPGQVIIENINEGDVCSGVKSQTEEGQQYILGLTRQLSGFMQYAEVNPLQKTAFEPTRTNLNKLASTCGLDDWSPPETGDQNRCPTANKPRWCTKIRDPTALGISVHSDCFSLIFLMLLLFQILPLLVHSSR